MDSILTSIKKMLGIDEEYGCFDTDLIIHINSVLAILNNDFGVGPATGFSIEGASEKWSDFLPETAKLDYVKTYVYLKVKLLFDPPTIGAVMESTNKLISELEWRITAQADSLQN